MKIVKKKDKDVWIIEIDGILSSGKEFDLEDELEFCLDKEEIPKILVDFKKVAQINSSSLSVLLNTYKRIEKKNGRLGICSLNSSLESLLELTKLTYFFEVFKNQEEALEFLND